VLIGRIPKRLVADFPRWTPVVRDPNRPMTDRRRRLLEAEKLKAEQLARRLRDRGSD
jgi:hypothetical protein